MTSNLSGLITIPFHIGDFLSGTMHMDTLEKGAYAMLLFSHYQSGEKGLPNDDRQLSRICGVTMKVWLRIKPILSQKFDIDDNFWTNSKVIDVLQKVHDKSSSQRAKALKRHRPLHTAAEPRQCQPKPKPKPIDTNVSNTPISPKRGKSVSCEKPSDVSDSVWNDFIQHRRIKKSTVTETVLKRIRSESTKAGWSMDEALSEICARGWSGFKAEWVKQENKKQTYSEGLLEAQQNVLEKIRREEEMLKNETDCYVY